MVIEGTASVHTRKLASIVKRGCKMTPHEQSAQDEKYSPRRRLKRRNREVLISTPMHHEMPVNAAIIMDIGWSFIISSMSRRRC
jgi:hypothetical protein